MAIDPIVQRERDAQTKIRAFVVFVMFASTAALLLSFLSIQTIDSNEVHARMRAWDWSQRGWLVASLLPGAWVMRTPVMRTTLVWSGWFAALGAIGIVKLAATPTVRIVRADPSWLGALLSFLVFAIGLVVVIVIPMVRHMTRPPPELPTARIHQD